MFIAHVDMSEIRIDDATLSILTSLISHGHKSAAIHVVMSLYAASSIEAVQVYEQLAAGAKPQVKGSLNVELKSLESLAIINTAGDVQAILLTNYTGTTYTGEAAYNLSMEEPLED